MNIDEQFFTDHPDRYAHIRKPVLELVLNKQRAAAYVQECEREFLSLGEHNKDRRRLLLWRVSEDHPAYDHKNVCVLKIPFLLFSDETVEDNDTTLLPIIHDIMGNAARKYGMMA
jgi:hypothetical protein